MALKPRWSLSPEAFEALLGSLHQDRAQAGFRYEQLRLKLVKFFTWERVTFPEERADEAFNRLARRLSEGESIGSPEAYLSGVARLLLREAFDQQRRERTLTTELTLAHARTSRSHRQRCRPVPRPLHRPRHPQQPQSHPPLLSRRTPDPYPQPPANGGRVWHPAQRPPQPRPTSPRQA